MSTLHEHLFTSVDHYIKTLLIIDSLTDSLTELKSGEIMKNPIAFLPAESSGNTTRQVKSNISQPDNHSFNQVLSKEISTKKSSSGEPATQNTVNRQSADDMAQKPGKPETQNRTQAEQDGEAEKKQPSTDQASVDTAQFIFFAENVAQYSPKVPTTPTDAAVDIADVADQNKFSAEILPPEQGATEAKIASAKPTDPLFSVPDTPAASATGEKKSPIEIISSDVKDIKNQTLISSMPTELNGDKLAAASCEPKGSREGFPRSRIRAQT